MEEKYYWVWKFIQSVVLSVNAVFLGSRNIFITSVLLWSGVQQLVPCVNIEATATGLPRLCAPSGIQLPPGFGAVDGWPPSIFKIIRPSVPNLLSPPHVSSGHSAAC